MNAHFQTEGIFKLPPDTRNKENFFVTVKGGKFFLCHRSGNGVVCSHLVNGCEVKKVLNEKLTNDCEHYTRIGTAFSRVFNPPEEEQLKSLFQQNESILLRSSSPSYVDFMNVYISEKNAALDSKILRIRWEKEELNPEEVEEISQLEKMKEVSFYDLGSGIELYDLLKDTFRKSFRVNLSDRTFEFIASAFLDELLAFQRGYITFYTGRDAFFSFLSIIYKLFKGVDHIFLSWLMEERQNSAKEFITMLQETTHNPDRSSELAKRMVSANISLFGNWRNDAENSISYFLSGMSMGDPTRFLRLFIKELTGKDCPHEASELRRLYDQEIFDQENNTRGELIAIRFQLGSSELEKYVYPAKPMGYADERYSDIYQFIREHTKRTLHSLKEWNGGYNYDQVRLLDLPVESSKELVITKYGGFEETKDLSDKIKTILKRCIETL